MILLMDHGLGGDLMRFAIVLVLFVPLAAIAETSQSGASMETQSSLELPQEATTTLPAPEAPTGPQVTPTAPQPSKRVPLGGHPPTVLTPSPGDPLPPTRRLPGVPTPEPTTELRSANQSATADLQITEIKRIASGRHRGKVAILVKAAPYEAGKRPPLEDFPIRLERGESIAWEGRGKVKNMLFGWGDQVITPYVLGDYEVTLRAVVNVPGMGRLYPEGTPDTLDYATHTFNKPGGASGGSVRVARPAIDETGEGDFETRIRGASVIREGASWQIVRITYDLHERDAERGHNRFDVRIVPGSGYRGEDFLCSGFRPGSGSVARTAPGQGRIAEYLCELHGWAASPARGHFHAALLRLEDRRMAGRGIDLRSKEWTHDESDTPMLPDFRITRVAILNGVRGPRSIEVQIHNDADFLLPAVTLHVAFVDRVDGTVATRTYEVLMHGGSGTAVLSVATGSDFEWVVGDREHQTGFLDLTVNRSGHVMETNFDNNSHRVNVADYYPRAR